MTRLAVFLGGCGLFLTVFGLTILGFALSSTQAHNDALAIAHLVSLTAVIGGLVLMTMSSLTAEGDVQPVKARATREP